MNERNTALMLMDTYSFLDVERPVDEVPVGRGNPTGHALASPLLAASRLSGLESRPMLQNHFSFKALLLCTLGSGFRKGVG